MFNRIARFVKNISFILLSLQGKFLQKRLIKRMGYKPNSSVKGCTIDLKKEANEANTEKLNNEVKAVLKRCNNNPQEILKFIQEHKTNVYFIKYGTKIFKLLKEEEGFIGERKGLKALILNLLTTKKFKFKTDAMFILNDDELDIYNIIHYFHKWNAYKNGLGGFDEKSQKLLKRFNSKNEDDIISRLSLTDIALLKEAIARDVQSINFVVQYSKETAGARNALEKLKSDDGANI